MQTSRHSQARALRVAGAFVAACWALQWLRVLSADGGSPQLRALGASTRFDDHAATSRVAATSVQPVELLVPPADPPGDRCALGSAAHTTKQSFIDYDYLVHCTRLRDSVLGARALLVVVLVVLLYLLSSTADAFFCPVLQAIVEKYRIPPDIAGVTFLSFGNGSPDVFSNIAAFSTATPKIGVTSILGGGLLVTTVIVASVGLASLDQEQLIPRKYMRDVLFYFVAVAYFCFVFFDGLVTLPEALGFLCIYAGYVSVILLDAHIAYLFYSTLDREHEEDEEVEVARHLPPYLTSSSRSSSGKSVSDIEEFTSVPMMIAYDVFRIPNYTSDSEQSETSATFSAPTLYRKSSAPTPRSKKDADFSYEDSPNPRERLPLLWKQPSGLRRPASVCVPSLTRRKRPRHRTVWESTEMSAHFNLTAKRWTRGYHELSGIEEFSSVSETGDEVEDETAPESESRLLRSPSLLKVPTEEAESAMERYLFRWFRLAFRLFEYFIWNPLEFVTTFIRRMTIPLIDEETWDKRFAMVCPLFATLLVGVTVLQLNPLENMYFAVAVLVGGGFGGAFVHFTASELTPPEGALLAPYICLAFGMSVIWIMNIANEVLTVLEVLGGLFGISNSVLGVSVLAWGNSIGDLVSNTSIARDGFPTMAFAGCFAGPMFNLLVGIGLALTIAIVSRGPISMGKPSPLVYVGFAYLFLSLLLNLVFSAIDGFRYRRPLCYTLLCLYASFVVVSVVIVVVSDSE